MKVWFFAFAEDVLQTNAGNVVKNHIVSPLSFISVPFVPATFSFGISCGLYCNSSDKGELSITFTHSDNDEQDKKDSVVLGPLVLDSIPRDPNIPEHLQGFLFNANLRNVILRKPGIYIAKILRNGEVFETHTIEVIVKS